MQSNCEVTKKFNTDEAYSQQWRKHNERRSNVIESSVCENVQLLRRQGLPVTRHVLK